MRRFFASATRTTARCTTQARRVVGHAQSPYGAALALESWLRSTGGFGYTNHPPPSRADPLLDFVAPHEARLLPALRRRDGADAPLPRHSRARRGGLRERHLRRRARTTWTVTDHDAHAWVEVWFARLRLAAVRPDARPRLALGGVLGLVAGLRTPRRSGSPARRRVAAQHGGAPPGASFGDKDAAIVRGTDIRPASRRPGGDVRPPAARRQPRQAARARRSRARGRAARAGEAARAPTLRYPTRDPRAAAAACRARARRLPRRPGHRRRRGARRRTSWRARAGTSSTSTPDAFAAAPDGRALRSARPGRARPRERARESSRLLRRGCAGGSGSCAALRGLVSLRSLGFARMNASSWRRARARRLRPLTERWPKPVLPIDGRPVIATLLRELRRRAASGSTVVTGHLAEQVEALLGDGSASARASLRAPAASRTAPPTPSPRRSPRRRRAAPRHRGRHGLRAAATSALRRARTGQRRRRSRSPRGRGRRAGGAVRVERRRVARVLDDDPANPLTARRSGGSAPDARAAPRRPAGPPFELADAFQQRDRRGRGRLGRRDRPDARLDVSG